MNQVVPVGNGFLILLDHEITRDHFVRAREIWKEAFPDVKAIFMPNTRYTRLADGGGIFEFKGDDITQEVVDEFRKWWDGQQEMAPRDDRGRPDRAPDQDDG